VIVDQFLQGDVRKIAAQSVKDICTWYLNYIKTINVNMGTLSYDNFYIYYYTIMN